jgi:hypothetical protein
VSKKDFDFKFHFSLTVHLYDKDQLYQEYLNLYDVFYNLGIIIIIIIIIFCSIFIKI